MSVDQCVEWLSGKTNVLGEDLSQSHFVNQKSQMTELRSNPAPLSGKPATTRHRYGTASLGSVVDTLTASLNSKKK
jgi:hypothetical protein